MLTRSGRSEMAVWHLVVRDLPQCLAPDSQVGVAQAGLAGGEPFGEPVGPAAVPTVGRGEVVEPFGEAVPERDIGANLHGHVSSYSSRPLCAVTATQREP